MTDARPMIDNAGLCGLIPHAGTMCLLDGVLEWDETHIVCVSSSHRDPGNPLAGCDGLAPVHLLEYGAQAMAVHGGLLARAKGETIAGGYLAAFRDVDLAVDTLAGTGERVTVSAEQLMAAGGNLIYAFEVADADRKLVSGRATVMATTGDAA